MKHLMLVPLVLIFTYCEPDSSSLDGGNNPGNSPDQGNWLIPAGEIYDGGPGKDGIPALESPEVEPAISATNDYLTDDDLVLAIEFSGVKRAYPHPVLDWHEIINDELQNHNFAVNYCPLTGTGMAWGRKLKNQLTTFGVSGLLYNTNLILYDRLTESYWSQMSLKSVKGELSGNFAEVYPMIEMKWSTWKSYYSNEEVVIPPENYSRPYGSYPYGDYKNDDNYFLFPISEKDRRLHQKKRVLAVIHDEEHAKVYPIRKDPGNYVFIRDKYFGEQFIVAGIDGDFLVAYKEVTHGKELIELEPAPGELPVLFRDESGSEWDIFGNAVSGINQGKKLQKMEFITGFWFTFPSFFENVDIYNFN